MGVIYELYRENGKEHGNNRLYGHSVIASPLILNPPTPLKDSSYIVKYHNGE